MRSKHVQILFVSELGQPTLNKRNSYNHPELGKHIDRVYHIGFEEFVLVACGLFGILLRRSLYTVFQLAGGNIHHRGERWLSVGIPIKGDMTHFVAGYAPQ